MLICRPPAGDSPGKTAASMPFYNNQTLKSRKKPIASSSAFPKFGFQFWVIGFIMAGE
jgi:hypothetical protein